MIKLEKRYAAGLSFTTSYVFSKMLTDADSYWITDNPRAADQGNRRLEKSIGSYDVTHNFKLGLTYELPFGPGKKWLSSGFASQILGGWRISSINLYSSGRPVAISGGSGLGIFNGRSPAFITSYEGLQPQWTEWRLRSGRGSLPGCIQVPEPDGNSRNWQLHPLQSEAPGIPES